MANLESAAKHSADGSAGDPVGARLEGLRLEVRHGQPLLVRNLFEHAPSDPDLRAEVESLAKAAGARDADTDLWADQLNELHELACTAADSSIARIAAVDSFALSADLLQLEHEGRRASERQKLRLLHAKSLAQPPSEGRGKRYRRAREPATETARQDAEAKERLKWAMELAGLLFEAKLPLLSLPARSRRTPCSGVAKG